MTLINTFLIPFFLAGHMVTEKDWEKGPLYTIKAETNVTMSGQEIPEVFAHFHTYMLCGTKSTDTLSCLFTDGLMIGASPESERIVIREFNITKEPFEIKFNDLGPETLTVNKDLEEDMLGVIKAYIRQLTVGANLHDKTEDQTFEVPKSSVEECKANMKFKYDTDRSKALTYDEDRSSGNDYHLMGLERMNMPEDKTMEITKDTLVDECNMKHVFDFDGTFIAYTPKEHMEEAGEKLDEMKSDMVVSRTGLQSCTSKKGIIGSKLEYQLNYAESIMLTLVDMKELTFDMPTVNNPKTVKMVEE